MLADKAYVSLLAELEELKQELQQSNDAIAAIRNGEVDALVVRKGREHHLYTLKSADHTYRMFIERMKEGAVTLNSDGIILYSNSQFAAFLGMQLSEVIGHPMIELIPPEHRQAFSAIMEKGWLSDSKGEICLRNSNGLIPFQLSVTSLELDDGVALSIILTDLTIQKEHEWQLKSKNEQLEQARQEVAKMNAELEDTVRARTKDLLVSREYFKFLADNIPVIVWTTRADGMADYFNKQWYEYTGLDFESSRDLKGLSVVHPDDGELLNKAWATALLEKKAFQVEYRLRRFFDGEYRWHVLKAEPVKDETGNLIAWFGTSSDIEVQKKELERKDEFIGVASHELKTPLTSLKGYVQLIGALPDLPAPVDRYVERANASLNKIQHLVNDLLDVSKIKAGKLKFDTSVLNLSELVKQCIDNCRFMYPLNNINIDSPEDHILVNGNDERLEQVLMNLVNNAVKYSPEKSEIIIRTMKDHATATVSVVDYGMGLSSADQEKIFDRFYRVDSNAAHISGLGMGLYISSEIIRQHNGALTVRSRPKEGSTFSFTLPLVDRPGYLS